MAYAFCFSLSPHVTSHSLPRLCRTVPCPLSPAVPAAFRFALGVASHYLRPIGLRFRFQVSGLVTTAPHLHFVPLQLFSFSGLKLHPFALPSSPFILDPSLPLASRPISSVLSAKSLCRARSTPHFAAHPHHPARRQTPRGSRHRGCSRPSAAPRETAIGAAACREHKDAPRPRSTCRRARSNDSSSHPAKRGRRKPRSGHARRAGRFLRQGRR